MSEKLTEKKMQDLVITISATSQLLHELLDELEETSYFRQSLKMATNRLQNELDKTCNDQTNALWAANDESMMGIQKGISEMIKYAVKADPLLLTAMGLYLKENQNILETT